MPAGHGIYLLLYQLITGEFSWLSECQAAARHKRFTSVFGITVAFVVVI
jgi:hypothetical protein